jgi:hypothetical protein
MFNVMEEDLRCRPCRDCVNDRNAMTEAETNVLLELEKILQTCNQMYVHHRPVF